MKRRYLTALTPKHSNRSPLLSLTALLILLWGTALVRILSS